jgi:hypothetical protein
MIELSRGTLIDTEKCVRLASNSRYDMVQMAVQRSRESGQNPVETLLEIQDGKVSLEYLTQLNFK